MPARVDLLRMQQLRGTGGNALRTSHNAPEPALLHIADRLGIVVMDENRVFATVVSCPGCPSVPEYAGDPVQDMADLVSRDKLHPSVIWWSFCNEVSSCWLRVPSNSNSHTHDTRTTYALHGDDGMRAPRMIENAGRLW